MKTIFKEEQFFPAQADQHYDDLVDYIKNKQSDEFHQYLNEITQPTNSVEI